MSASNQKKIRKEKAMAYMSERQRKEAEEQKKLKRYTVTFWVILALCACIVLSTVLTNPIKNVVYQNTTAVTIGDHELSATEVNYFYVDAINSFCNQYSYYLSYMLDTKKPLNEQVYDKATGATWADNFLNSAIENIKSTYQLYDLAMKDGFKLSDEEKASIETAMANIDIYATYYQYNNGNAYLRSVYGNGANEKSYRAYYEVCAIASAYYTAHAESLEYDDADLRAFEADKMEQYDSYTFAYYEFKTNSFLKGGTKSEDGKTTTYTDEEKAAAAKVAEELANKLAEGKYEDLDAFDEAINDMLTQYFNESDDKKTEDNKENTNAPKTGDNETSTEDETTEDETTEDETTEDETTEDETTKDEENKDEEGKDEDKEEDKKKPLKYTSTKQEDVLYSQVNTLFIDWLIGKEKSDDETDDEKDEDKEETLVVRQMGDMTVIVNETKSGEKTTINGYYVLRFGSVSDNTVQLKDVRHILISFEGGKKDSNGNVTYSDAEKKAAKAKAEKLLEEFKGTDMTEETFAELAKKNTGDTGSKANGGLYEDVYPGQMVTNFNDWCFDETRKTGDVGIVESEYGYHIMYFVGDSETNYRDYMIENDVRNDELTKWMEDLIKTADLTAKNLKHVNKGMVLSAG